MKKLMVLTLILVLTALAQLTAPPVQAEVSIPDANLAAAISEALALPAGAAITAEAMLNLTELEARGRGITDLTGLEHAVNLIGLDLGDGGWVNHEWRENPISNVSPLASLTNLESLDLGSTAVSDVSALAGLTNLEKLDLRSTAVSDVSALAGLTNLEWLDLAGTDVSDVSALAGLTNLKTLDLAVTFDVSDVSALANLTNLEALDLFATAVSDVSALAGLTNLKTLDLSSTDVSDVSALASLTKLEILTISRTAVSDVSALAHLTKLKTLDLSQTGVSDVSALAHLTKLESLNLELNLVFDVSALASLTKLKKLNLENTKMSDVSALANLTNLEELYLFFAYSVSDVSALANLTNLKKLDLSATDVSDVSALASLTKLVELDLSITAVSDVSALANLTNLERLDLGGTGVSDVSALASLTKLEWLQLAGTDVSDVSALASLTKLEELYLFNTAVSDISALAHLTNLERLDLKNTNVSDVSPLLGLSLPGTRWNSIRLRLENCPLGYASIHTHIPALQAKGIEVAFDNVAHPALLKVSGDRQEGEPGAMLKTAFIVEAMDEQGEPIVGRTVQFDILGGGGSLSAETVETDAQGKARVTLTLGNSQGVNKVKASSEGIQSWVLFTAVGREEVPQLVADVNGDGVVNVQDLVLVSGQFGKTGEHGADVNGDGVVNIQDLVLVAGVFGEGAAAPSVRAVSRARLTASDVEGWLIEARGLIRSGSGDPSRPGGLSYGRGIAVLERLLASLMPKETVLLANYPNPFNPETWIPYQLAEPVEVTVSIHSADGKLVRTLTLGQMPAGVYQGKNRAAYWDGRNAQGEFVASGVYFYTLAAGDFSATRKMVIRK